MQPLPVTKIRGPIVEFSRKVDLGHIVTVLVLLFGMAVMWGKFEERFASQARSLERLENIADKQIRLEALVEEHHRQDRVLSPNDCVSIPAPRR